MERTELRVPGGRTLAVYDSGEPATGGGMTVFWQHGSPQIGVPPEPLLRAGAQRGMRWLSLDRPGYGGSTARPGRDVASVARDVSAAADACGVGRFAGMHPASAAELRAARDGRGSLERLLRSAEFDMDVFTAEDQAALSGDWSSLAQAAAQGLQGGLDGLLDDDLAFTLPWGIEPEDVHVPVLLVHGGRDRVVPPAHSDWLARRCPSAELWTRPADGHISVLTHCAAALDWVLEAGR